MTMLMKQGLLTWSPCDPHFISRFSQSYLNPQKSLKPTSSFTIFAARNDPNASNFISPLREVSECGGSLLVSFDFKGKVLEYLRRILVVPIDKFCINLSGQLVWLQKIVKCVARMLRRLPATMLIVTNAIVFDKPLEALAETCQADNSVFNMNMPLLLFVALIGATVGGLLARQRRGELQRLNEQLRQINAALRRQAKIESYAPSLSYAPVGGRIAEDEVIVDPRQSDLISRLKNGKNFLRNQEPEKAFFEFKTALELAQNLKDPIEEKKAARGLGYGTVVVHLNMFPVASSKNTVYPILGASLQRQGKYRDAIKYHSMVLEVSQREGEESGNTEAYGAIADCYTELGDLERAAKYYDQYISRLQSD
ncbi:UNVERIFIED_CONTAM: protein FLUORESCENT IN BLUE LIGHT, chloroplastic [Sesamum angustifolium]|uniref:Protein FLUORESCENT IN BLUE LIGHT, chloroplastic n=1 Tax=Sesamum angustifolium TaxID=2727405 RepID=A0AAW2MRP9_9LAMI